MNSSLVQQVSNDVLSINEFLTDAVLVRSSAGTYNEFGEWQEGDPVLTDIKVVMNPVSFNRNNMPEGLQEEELMRFFVQAELEALKAGQSDGDLIRVGSEEYRVVMVKRWRAYSEVTATLQR